MNISNKLKGLLAACVAAAGLTAFAEPTVTVDSVETYQPWSKIGVSYTLGGTDAALDYRVAFDVTAGGQTAGVTNDVPKPMVEEGWQVIDTVALFGKQIIDAKAKVKVSLIEVSPKTRGTQLWADGPFWAETNLGESEVQDCPEYGALYTFDSADSAVKSLLGQSWRVPSKDEFEKLIDSSYCTKTWNPVRKGYIFTGVTEGFTDKSIFLPVAGDKGPNDGGRTRVGERGIYWSSESTGTRGWFLNLNFAGGTTTLSNTPHNHCMSIRAVR